MSTTKETQSQYAKSRQQSHQDRESQEIEFQVSEAQLQLQADVLATKQSLAGKRKELKFAKEAFPLDAQSIINLQIQVESLEDGLTRLENLEKELF